MLRNLLTAGALSLALTLGACNANDVTALSNAAATTSPNLPPSAVVSDVLAGSGVSASGIAKVNQQIATVQKAAEALCRIKPLASGLLNIGIALSPSLSTVASTGVAQQIGGAATIACNALASAPVYTSTRRGQFVKAMAQVPVNGGFVSVPVYGIRQ
jgi:hypothetical protein